MSTLKGGEKFKERLRAMAGLARKLTDSPVVLRVGFLENAKYPDGKPVAMIAAIHNWGAPRAGIPPRPFFSNMIAEKKGEWPAAIAALLKANDYDVDLTLEQTGQAISRQLRESIIKTNAPPLKPRTIVRKGGTRDMVYDPRNPKTFAAKPLVHTGHMLNSVDHEVRRRT